MKCVYMNHRIKQKNPRKPVIVCQGDTQTREANEFLFYYDGVYIGRVVFDRKGLPTCETHEVKAWVELEQNVAVVVPGEIVPIIPVAHAKEPNKKVTT